MYVSDWHEHPLCVCHDDLMCRYHKHLNVCIMNAVSVCLMYHDHLMYVWHEHFKRIYHERGICIYHEHISLNKSTCARVVVNVYSCLLYIYEGGACIHECMRALEHVYVCVCT
jgi:hypothetical protein